MGIKRKIKGIKYEKKFILVLYLMTAITLLILAMSHDPFILALLSLFIWKILAILASR